ncbi:MAG: FG-GAP repeat domain-containing protein [Candidatus Heimdallarchaeaceae archaeon]
MSGFRLLKRKAILILLLLLLSAFLIRQDWNKITNTSVFLDKNNISSQISQIQDNPLTYDTFQSDETTSILVEFEDSTGTRKMGKFSYIDGKWVLQWLKDHMNPGAVEDADNDGVLEIYTWFIEAYEDNFNYTFYRLDENTGEIVWSQTLILGSSDYYRFYEFEDFNGDGIQELIFGKQFNDDTSPTPVQLLIFDSTNGDILVNYDGGYPKLGSFPILYDYDNDGVRDIMFYGWPDDSNTYFRMVNFKDFIPTTLVDFNVSTWGLSKPYIYDFDSDGLPEWLIGGWGSSYWRLYDTDLTEIWSVSLEGSADGNYLVTDELLSKGLIAIGTGSYGGTSEYIHLLDVNTGVDAVPAINIPGNSLFFADAVFDYNNDGNYEILTNIATNQEGFALIDTSTGNKLWQSDSPVSRLPYYYLSNNNYQADSFVDFDNDGHRDIIDVDKANGDVLHFLYNGSVVVLGNLINDNSLDAVSSTMYYSMIYKAPIIPPGSDFVYIDDFNKLWINTDYYEWCVTNDTSFVLKTGTESEVVSLGTDVLSHFIQTKQSESYEPYEFTRMDIVYNDGYRANISLEQKMIYSSKNEVVYLELNMSVQRNSGLIKVSGYIYNPNNYSDVYNLETRLQLTTGGDQANDYYYYSGALDALSFPFDSGDLILPSEVSPYNNMMYVTMFDDYHKQGFAMFANYSYHGDGWTDEHYGNVMSVLGDKDNYGNNSLSLVLTANETIEYYLLFYTTTYEKLWLPVETAIDTVRNNGTIIDNIAPAILNIQYSPENPTELDTIDIYANVVDYESDVQFVMLVYESNGEWFSPTMTYIGDDTYNCTLGPFEANSLVSFYIIAVDIFGNFIGSELYEISISIFIYDDIPPTITDVQYTPSEPTDQTVIEISAKVTDESQLKYIKLYYTIGDSTVETSVLMTPSDGVYYVQVGPFIKEKKVTFYIEASDIHENIASTSQFVIYLQSSSQTDSTSSAGDDTNNKNTIILPFPFITILIVMVFSCWIKIRTRKRF